MEPPHYKGDEDMVGVITYVDGSVKILVLHRSEIEELKNDNTVVKIEVASLDENMSDNLNERHVVLVEYETYGEKLSYQNTSVPLTELPETVKAMIEINTSIGMEIPTIIVIPVNAFETVMEDTSRLSLRCLFESYLSPLF